MLCFHMVWLLVGGFYSVTTGTGLCRLWRSARYRVSLLCLLVWLPLYATLCDSARLYVLFDSSPRLARFASLLNYLRLNSDWERTVPILTGRIP